MKKIALIGAGNLGKIHLKYLTQSKNIDLIGVVEVNADQRNTIKKNFGVQTFSNYEDIVNDVDAVMIVTPTETHFKIAKFFAENGKDIFVEKPVTKKLKDALELKEIAKKTGSIIQVGHIERFNPVIQFVKDKIKEPKFIQTERLAPFFISGRIKDVGAILDLMIHDIDIINYFVKSEIKDVETVGFSAMSRYDDMAITRLKFENGCYAILSVSRMSLKKERKIRIFQKNGYFSLDLLRLKVKNVTGSIENGKINLKPVFRRFRKKDTIRFEQEDFFNSIEKGIIPEVSIDDGIKAIKVAEMIEKELKIYEG